MIEFIDFNDYTITCIGNDNMGYTIQLAEFPEVIEEGKTLSEARNKLMEAWLYMCKVFEEEGRPIPRPKNFFVGVRE